MSGRRRRRRPKGRSRRSPATRGGTEPARRPLSVSSHGLSASKRSKPSNPLAASRGALRGKPRWTLQRRSHARISPITSRGGGDTRNAVALAPREECARASAPRTRSEWPLHGPGPTGPNRIQGCCAIRRTRTRASLGTGSQVVDPTGINRERLRQRTAENVDLLGSDPM
jgi:hypothetical protein